MTLPANQGQQRRPAEVARWDPFDELQQQLAQVFQDWPQMRGPIGSDFMPVADVEETDDAFVVDIELPGVKKNDIDLEVMGRRLIVTGERTEKERKGILRHQTRAVGRFRFEVVLPADVDDTGVEASLEHGVLEVRIPKASADKPKRIEIR
ncbi:MAG TPA: Hsp20/alpha crystallin family protein [Acidimicrobiales bacterium]|nr:Hsp20/alpha crystallin family protein [Acidimicrobiales bacterium]